MARTANSISAKRNGRRGRPAVSKLGQQLTRIAKLIDKSGLKPLTREEVEREVAERRGARY